LSGVWPEMSSICSMVEAEKEWNEGARPKALTPVEDMPSMFSVVKVFGWPRMEM
jgi:hypothetical protein